MANPVQTALRRSNATQRLLRAAEHVRSSNPKTKDCVIGARSKDPGVNGVELLESLASFLETLGDVTPQPVNVINHCVSSPDPSPDTESHETVTHTIEYSGEQMRPVKMDAPEKSAPPKPRRGNK